MRGVLSSLSNIAWTAWRVSASKRGDVAHTWATCSQCRINSLLSILLKSDNLKRRINIDFVDTCVLHCVITSKILLSTLQMYTKILKTNLGRLISIRKWALRWCGCYITGLTLYSCRTTLRKYGIYELPNSIHRKLWTHRNPFLRFMYVMMQLQTIPDASDNFWQQRTLCELNFNRNQSNHVCGILFCV